MKPTSQHCWILSGVDHERISTLAIRLVRTGDKVILLPSGTQYPQLPFPVTAIHLEAGKTTSKEIFPQETEYRWPTDDWALGMFTSGSTGQPKLFVFSKEQLELTAAWYQSIYRVERGCVVISCMPSTYNFTFIAGAWTCALHNCVFEHQPLTQIAARIQELAKTHRTILLANPLILEHLAQAWDSPRVENLLIDTGGAPASVGMLQLLRRNVGDVREGYGLTETCSLTHFDSIGSNESCGTVGTPMRSVRTLISMDDGKPNLLLGSPNLGRQLLCDGTIVKQGELYLSGDLGKLNEDSSLRLLGRSTDCCVNGYWPRDILDEIGSILPQHSPIVVHPSPQKILAKFLTPLTDSDSAAVTTRLSRVTGVSPSQVELSGHTGPVTHSYKLTRPVA